MISGMHLLVLVVVLLLFFGPSRLPGLGKSVGEAIRGFKKGIEGDELDVTNTAKREKLAPGEETQGEQQSAQQTKEKSRNDV